MTGLVRKATLLSLCGLLVAAVAFAGTPSGTFSTFPPNNCVKLVGRSGATTFDPSGTFTIIVRDGGGNLVPNSNVVLDFSSCPDVHMGDQASNLQFAGNAGLTENAAFKQVTRAAGPTNGLPAGQVSFTLLGGSTNGGPGGGAVAHPGSGFLCCKVIADNTQIGTLTIAVFDEDGSKTINSGDAGLALGDTFSPGAGATAAARTDFDCNGVVNSADVAVLQAVAFGVFVNGPAAFAW